MALSKDSRAEKKLKIILRNRFRTRQQLEYVDFTYDTLDPIIEAIKAGKAVPELGLLAGEVFDIQVVNESSAQDAAEGNSTGPADSADERPD